ncbi:unnamed protein product [Protopolystoma xenopodis]|uniref:Uncharacterized protein n=1 Tax=Protopolystoma xenopodis TaxID=117903 RepID=A0A3S4ZU41_9PLAT|nr:unnamed protein product [Protopolystoma xenopodis]
MSSDSTLDSPFRPCEPSHRIVSPPHTLDDSIEYRRGFDRSQISLASFEIPSEIDLSIGKPLDYSISSTANPLFGNPFDHKETYFLGQATQPSAVKVTVTDAFTTAVTDASPDLSLKLHETFEEKLRSSDRFSSHTHAEAIVHTSSSLSPDCSLLNLTPETDSDNQSNMKKVPPLSAHLLPGQKEPFSLVNLIDLNGPACLMSPPPSPHLPATLPSVKFYSNDNRNQLTRSRSVPTSTLHKDGGRAAGQPNGNVSYDLGTPISRVSALLTKPINQPVSAENFSQNPLIGLDSTERASILLGGWDGTRTPDDALTYFSSSSLMKTEASVDSTTAKSRLEAKRRFRRVRCMFVCILLILPILSNYSSYT